MNPRLYTEKYMYHAYKYKNQIWMEVFTYSLIGVMNF